MKKIALFFLSALILIAASCKLDPAIFPDGVTPGTGTTTGEVNNSASGYQPTTKGSYWNLKPIIRDFPTGQAPVVTVQAQATTMTGEKKTINNKVYYVGTTTLDADKGYTYYYHGNDTYSYRTDLISQDVVIEYVYLKDNYDIGKTWTEKITDSGMLNGVKAQIVGQIAEKGISLKVGTTDFKDVIHTKLQLQYDSGGGFLNYQDMDYYIAKGVGIIYISTKNNISSNGTSTTSLTDYVIK
jgi:hypothetical protein